MKIALGYICVSNNIQSHSFSSVFLDSYRQFKPAIEHKCYAICNGGPPDKPIRDLFLQNGFNLIERPNVGGDIGGHFDLANMLDVDLMFCFGQSIRLWRSGWMDRVVSEWDRFGRGLYGFFPNYSRMPHLITTGFACSPGLLTKYPLESYGVNFRYNFEHGKHSFWRRLARSGLPAKLVTWSGAYDPEEWRKPSNIMWRGDQSDCLVFCNHTERYFAANATTKLLWERQADGL